MFSNEFDLVACMAIYTATITFAWIVAIVIALIRAVRLVKETNHDVIEAAKHRNWRLPKPKSNKQQPAEPLEPTQDDPPTLPEPTQPETPLPEPNLLSKSSKMSEVNLVTE